MALTEQDLGLDEKQATPVGFEALEPKKPWYKRGYVRAVGGFAVGAALFVGGMRMASDSSTPEERIQQAADEYIAAAENATSQEQIDALAQDYANTALQEAIASGTYDPELAAEFFNDPANFGEAEPIGAPSTIAPTTETTTTLVVDTPEVLEATDLFTIVQDLNDRRHEALATGNMELLSSVYSENSAEADGLYVKDVSFIKDKIERYGTANYADVYTYVYETTIVEGTMIVIEQSDMFTVVKYDYLDLNGQTRSSIDTIVPATEGSGDWLLFDRESDYDN